MSLDLYRSTERYPCHAIDEFCGSFFAVPHARGWSTIGEDDPEAGGYIAYFKLAGGTREYVITGECNNWAINLVSSVKQESHA